MAKSDQEFIEAAREQYGKDGVEIDEGAVISRGSDKGAYVGAWVWVDDTVPSENYGPEGGKDNPIDTHYFDPGKDTCVICKLDRKAAELEACLL